MAESKLINFLEEIKMEFCWYLYIHEYFDERISEPEIGFNEKQRYKFPYCCKLAANLISSYIKVHFDGQAKCVSSIKTRFNHSWCESPQVGMIVDYTMFQFKLNLENRERFKTYKLDKKEFCELLAEIPIIYKYEEHYQYPCEWIERIEEEKLGIEEAKAINGDPFNVGTFMEYVRRVSEIINIKLEYR